ncbi:MAG: hypothetical protein EBX40_05055, partial [Gammaproteobacteria bacterium]|nr:hypothetical protein [Gammaproteobacteria bacterium]
RPYLPVILGENPPCEPLLQEAQHLNAPDYIHGVDFSAQEISPTTWRFKHQNVDLTLPIPKIWLNNASCAVMASILLREHFLISDEAIATGLQNTFILGRFQQVPWLCRLILDAAHNPAGATLLSKQLAALEPVSGRRYAIFAAKANKNIAEMIQTLRPHVDEWIVVDEIGLASKESLKTDYLPEASLFPTAYSALKSLSNRVTDSDSILVFGSCYLVGSALSALEHIYSGPFLSRRSN